MGNVRARPETGLLFLDFMYRGARCREQTTLTDTPANRRRAEKALAKIEEEISLGQFDYLAAFGKAPPPPKSITRAAAGVVSPPPTTHVPLETIATSPTFASFAETWFKEVQVTWRRSYVVTQRGALDKYLIPHFGAKQLNEITKADVLVFRAELAQKTVRKGKATLSNRRVNAVMKPLRQIMNEAADRFNFLSPFRGIKPLKIKRTDVMPFSLAESQLIISTVRADFRSYFVVRMFTGMRTGEVHGLKWKYVDFERNLILVREAIVLGEEDEVKTEESIRDIQMNAVVRQALLDQHKVTGSMDAGYVFCNRTGKPIDNKNFLARVWAPLLRRLNLTHRRAYQMRHTAATLWLASGEAPEWIARQLGHTTTEMLFRVYSRFVPNLTRQDGSAMDRLLKQHIEIPLVGPAGVLIKPAENNASNAQAQPPPQANKAA